jgi:hypothetical protein
MPASTPNPVGYPLGAPVVSGTEITVDVYSQQPTRVTRLLQDLTLQRFLIDRIFASGGGVTGGAVIYDLVTENDLYALRDVEKVAAGAEFPNITSARLAPAIATPDKWGGKFYMTDEARDRNDAIAFMNQTRKLANTIVRKLNQYAVGVLDAAITANSRTLAGNSWSAAIPNGATPTAPGLTPFGDLAKARKNAEVDELGIEYDTLLVNPAEELALLNFAQFNPGNLRTILGSLGVSDYFASNRVTAGTAYLLASGQVGQLRIESPLQTESWRDQKTQRTWWQSAVRPVAFVDNPFAAIKLTGIA